METKKLTQQPTEVQQIIRGAEEPEQLQIDWEALDAYEVENENESKMLFKDVYSGVTTVVIFIRHFLCFTAKEYVEDLAKIPRQTLEKARIRLVVIGCGKPKFMKQFRKDTGYWAEFYTDTRCDLYKLMGCKNSSFIGKVSNSMHAKSSAVMGTIKSAIRSTNFPGEWQGDTNQQGGAFILGPDRKCSFAHIDANGTDHYPINKLLDLVGLENICFDKDRGVHTV